MRLQRTCSCRASPVGAPGDVSTHGTERCHRVATQEEGLSPQNPPSGGTAEPRGGFASRGSSAPLRAAGTLAGGRSPEPERVPPPATPVPSPFTPVQPSAWRRAALRPAAPSRPLLLGARGLRPARSGGRGQPPTPVIASPPGAAVMNEPRTRVLSGIDAVISSCWRRDAGWNREHASGPPLAVRGGGRSGAGSGRDGCRGPAHVLAPGSALSRPLRVCGPWFSYRRTRRAS